MPTQLVKDNVYKYSSETKQISIYCCQAFTLFEKSFRKIRQIYLTDQAIYIISRKKLKVRVPLNFISKVYAGILSGEFFLVSEKLNFIIDYAQGRTKFIENIQQISPQCQVEYVNYTMLDFLFQKHKKINTKMKLTEYDANEKKVQLKYATGEKLNLRQLRQKWELKTANTQLSEQKKQKDYELTQVILTNTYWNIFVAKHKPSNKQYTVKIYSKKFIGVQETLLQSILNERKFLQSLTTSYIPSLTRAFYSPSNIYLVCELYNGYLLEVFNYVKKHKIVNLLAQIVIAVGQLHEAGLVYGNVSRNGIFITLEGYVFLINMGMSVEKGKELSPEINLKPPEAYSNTLAQFAWDWWNLAQLMFEIVQRKPFYDKKTPQQIEEFLKDPSDKLPSWIDMQKWFRDEEMLHLFQMLLKKNPQQRLGYKNDYHEILHCKFFEDWLKEHSKSQIMKKKCPPVFKKVNKPSYDQKQSQQIQKNFILDEDWSEMNGYLKDFDYARDVE